MKEQPRSDDAERNLISSCLIDNQILNDTNIIEEHFWNQSHRIIWQAMNHLNTSQGGVDITTLMEHLRVTGDLNNVGGSPYLLGILDSDGSGVFWDVYEKTILEHYTRRQIIHATTKATDYAYNLNDPNDILTGLEHFLTTTKVGNNNNLQQAIDSAARYATGEALVKTGFPTLDNAFGGFTRNDLTIIGARTSTGKSATIHAIANRIAMNEGGPVTIFTPDQPIPEVLALQAAREAKVRLSLFRHGKATEDHRKKYLEALDGLKDGFLKRVHFKQGILTLDSFQTESIRAIRNGAVAIIVDTVNRFTSKNDKMHTTLSEFGSMAKSIAAEYDVPIIGLAQLRRELDWEDRAPTRADLADAPGALANDANMILLLHREKDPERSRIMNVIVDKAKADAAGGRSLQLVWDPDYATIKDILEKTS